MTAEPSSPPQWVEALGKILELEDLRGYNNSAVSGGMDRFIQHWAEAIRDYLESSAQALDLVQVEYGSMTPEERRKWASLARKYLPLPPMPVEPQDATAPPPTGSPTPAPEPRQSAPNAATSRPRSKSSRSAPPGGLDVDATVDRLRGVSSRLSARLQRLGVVTVRDLLYLFPRRHQDYSHTIKISEALPDQECTVVGHVWDARAVKLGAGGRLKATEAVISDESGNVKLIWFGQDYIAKSLEPNARIAISGKPSIHRGQLVFESPDYEVVEDGQTSIHTGRLTPVYPLTEGLNGRNLRRLIHQALNEWLGGLEEVLPVETLQELGLMSVRDAVMQAHYPDNLDAWDAARRRLAFDELLSLQLAVLARRRRWNQGVTGVPIPINRKVLRRFVDSLPFPLTAAQRRCVTEILNDLDRGAPPMNRLLQGEVGSGKTVVVLVALLSAAAAGYQGAIMVPTEVLAEQHFQTITELLSGLAQPVKDTNRITVYLENHDQPISVGLLTGSTRARARRELTQLAAEGNLDLLVGTHALIQSGVDIPNLALAVMDEQHRFGVTQRSALRRKGAENPHTLVLSATPIPRTLSLTLYGDLDISTIDELPPGRQEVRTRWLGPDKRDAAYGFIQRQVQEGRQAFIIYPLVEESDAVEAKAATEDHQRLSNEVFPGLRVGLLHGRMSAKDKDRVMRQFRDGDLDILVSTAVVEVGIDVPNATVMLVEGADRFGLSQLHQFRGRVGRGQHRSYCILISDDPSAIAKERLSALEQNNDGFHLAEVDLELRGPGDFFGTRQSGLPDLRMAQLSDRELLRDARQVAETLMEEDPNLEAPEHAPLARQVTRFLNRVSDELS